jgi:hypothetical protein
MTLGGDKIAPLVATLISTSSKLQDIPRLFRDISKALQGISSSKATQLLKPFQSKPIFPVTSSKGKGIYDALQALHNASWFIADRATYRKAFMAECHYWL